MCEYLHIVHAVIPPEKSWKIYTFWKIFDGLQHGRKISAIRALCWCKFYVESSGQTCDTGCGLFLLQGGTHICSHSFMCSITVKMVMLLYMDIHLICSWFWSFVRVSYLCLVSESGGVLCSICFCTQATCNWCRGHQYERHCSGSHGSWYLWHEWTCEWTGTDTRLWSMLEWVHFSRLNTYIYIYMFTFIHADRPASLFFFYFIIYIASVTIILMTTNKAMFGTELVTIRY